MSDREQPELFDDAESANYWQDYGMFRDPFIPAEDGFFIPSVWEEHLELLQHLAQYGNNLLLVTGSEGAGKTTFLQLLMQRLENGLVTHKLDATEQRLEPASMMAALNSGFDLPVKELENSVISEAAKSILESVNQADRNCMLAVDNAHQLPPATLELLLAIVAVQADGEIKLHVVLFGEPELEGHLMTIAEKDDHAELLHNTALKPLTTAETTDYLQFCLSSAGYDGSGLLDDEEIAQIHKYSKGYIGRVNHEARLLLQAPRPDASGSGFDLGGIFLNYKKAVIATGVGLVTMVIAGAAYFMMPESAPAVITAKAPTTATQKDLLERNINLPNHKQLAHKIKDKLDLSDIFIEPKLLENPKLKIDDAAIRKEAGTNAEKKATRAVTTKPLRVAHHLISHKTIKQALTQPVAEAKSAVAVKTTAKPDIHHKPGAHVATMPQKVHHTLRMAEVKKQAAALKQIAKEQKARARRGVSATKSVTKIVTKPLKVTGDNLSLDSLLRDQATANKAPVAQKRKVIKIVTKKKVIKAVRVSRAKSTGRMTRVERRIMNVSGKRYTLQIVAASHLSGIKKFIAKHRLGKRAYYYRTTRSGRPWYVLIYGSYTDSAQARSAIQNLPASLKGMRPWPRSYADVKRSLNKR